MAKGSAMMIALWIAALVLIVTAWVLLKSIERRLGRLAEGLTRLADTIGRATAVFALVALLGATTVSAQGLSPEDEIKFDEAIAKLEKARARLLNIREKLFGVEQTLSDQGIVAEDASARVGDISTTNLDWKKRNDVAGALSGFLAPFLGLLGVSGAGAGAIFAVRSRAKKRAAAAAGGRPTVHLAGLPKAWRGANAA